MVAVADEERAPPGPDGFTDEQAAERDRAEREREGEPAPALAPALCWRPAQVAADLALAKQLMATVDKEKGIGENPLLPRPAAAAGGEGEDEAAAAEGQGEEGQQAAAADQAQQQQDGGEGGSGPADMDAELSPEEQLAKLDQVGSQADSFVLFNRALAAAGLRAAVAVWCVLAGVRV